ncbi:MAG TPA: hypothetical protein PLK37_07515, partial [Terricaulis sp.]|nr:hypothetical protein [Terricaulis sp.]
EDAAAHADAAAQRAIEALRLSREAMEQALSDQASETRAVVHGAFADAAERIDALADRVLENQRTAHRMGEQLNARLNNSEDAAQSAFEDLSETLRQSEAALGAEIGRASADARAAHAEQNARHDEAAQRLKTIDFALNNAIADMGALREEAHAALSDAETVFEARHSALESDTRARIEALIARLDHVTEAAAHDDQQAAANIDRVEACAFAALQKLAGDIAAGDSAQAQKTAELGARLERTQEEHTALSARVSVMDKALDSQDRAHAEMRARVQQLEMRAGENQTEHKLAALADDVGARLGTLELHAADTSAAQAIASLSGEVETIAKQVRENDALAQLAELRLRVESQNSLISDSADRTHGVARMLSRVSAQNADAAAQADERLHKLELAVADVRLEIAGAGDDGETAEIVLDIADRMAALERRQADALDGLRENIAAFIEENERRLSALEQGGVAALSGDEVLIAHAIETRLTELEQRDVGAEFEDLRRRIEERILGVERSSVRALEQMADTISLIEKRYSDEDEELARSA